MREDPDDTQGPVHPIRSRQHAGAAKQQGKLGWILMWLLGVPIPLLIILFLVRGCT